ncbi:hypothetical protein LN042_19965 [Kitasatospora sp. RB6PN24]|uniref:hypothetical protein n=1 Tax=Kitasatospora humi TaxID=2893891 RepID=UPI001E4790BC|nr:hypothetical protein [Kitasatospora humi]MCC9309330.1 hypothetical protein [Kitasatospora humi]
MDTASTANDEWAATMTREARELMEMWHGDPDLLDTDPAQALVWLDDQLSEIDTRDFTEDEIRPAMAGVMSLLAETIIKLHGARWETQPEAPAADRHVLVGGRLKGPVRLGPLVMRAFQKPHVSAVEMLNEAELEGRIRMVCLEAPSTPAPVDAGLS